MHGWRGNLRHVYVSLLMGLSHSQAGRQVHKKGKEKGTGRGSHTEVSVLRKWAGSVQSGGVKGQVAATGRTKETGKLRRDAGRKESFKR